MRRLGEHLTCPRILAPVPTSVRTERVFTNSNENELFLKFPIAYCLFPIGIVSMPSALCYNTMTPKSPLKLMLTLRSHFSASIPNQFFDFFQGPTDE
jgi:hypothetical protein